MRKRSSPRGCISCPPCLSCSLLERSLAAARLWAGTPGGRGLEYNRREGSGPMRQAATSEQLARSPVFGPLPTTVLDGLAASMQRRLFKRGQVIFHQEDP